MSSWKFGWTVLICCLALGFGAKTVNPRNRSEAAYKTPSFTARKLHGREPLYDDQSVADYLNNDRFGLYKKNQEITVLCREINIMAHGRIYKALRPIVYDAMATDKQTNIRAVVKTCGAEDDAMRWAREGLINKLFSDGLIDECILKPFSAHVVSANCEPNTNINCSSSCSFHCDKRGLNLIGSSTITCQTRGTLSADQPTCEVPSCSIPLLPPHLKSNRLPCSQGLDIDYGTSCEFSCEQNYSLNGSSIVNCLADGTLSGPIPTCADRDEGFSTSPSSTTIPTSNLTKKDSPSPILRTTTPTSISSSHGIPVSTERVSTLTTSTSLMPYTETGNGTTRRSVDSNPYHIRTGYFALIAIPAVIILLAIPFLISARRKAYRYRGYHYLDDTHDILANQESWLGFGEECTFTSEANQDISPDVDGYYTSSHILPAQPTPMQLDPRENYNMASREKGVVFILNNNNFPDGRFRKGSEIDVENVTHVFREIGYRPQLYEDLVGNEIRNALTSLVDKIKDWHTSVVLILMSHGEEAGILGIDGNLITMAEIKERFSGRQCPALIAKPKIIFVQACRGKTMTRCATDSGSTRHGRSEVAGLMTTDSLFQPTTSMKSMNFPLQTWASVDTDCNVPDNADMYIAHATSEGYFSMRDRVNGSWFIQALCEELLARAHLDDLDTIMTKVTRRVKNREAKIKVQGQVHRALQTPQTIKQGIGKQIYFLPKYPSRDSQD